MEERKEQKIIKSGRVARKLLQKGYKIVDIKAHKQNKKGSVFVFVAENNFYKDVEKIQEKLREKYKSKLKGKLEKLD